MFFTKDRKTGYIFDPWKFLGPKRRNLLETSWAGLFRKVILPKLPLEKIKKYFSSFYGRPTKDLCTVLGVIILQQMHDLSDDETVEQLAFNIQWQYALDIPEESDSANYICPKTLWSMRKLITDKNLDSVLFEKITGVLAEVFEVDLKKQRLDSVHIKSNMRRLSRIGIFAETIHKFLLNLRRQHKELLKTTVPEEIVKKYLPEKSLSSFSLVKPSDSKKTLQSVSSDLFSLVTLFRNNSSVEEMYSYKLLCRVLEEQCIITEEGQGSTVSIKPAKEVPSDSLQNPSDPDAGYDGHKGQGYQVQVMETYHRDQENGADEKALNLITHVAVEGAHKSDANALIPAIESTQKRGLTPEEILADTLYGSDENCMKAAGMGVEIISPAAGSDNDKALTIADFAPSPENKRICCPEGNPSLKHTVKKNRHSLAFSRECCTNCSRLSQCPVKPGKKYCYLRYNDKAMRLSQRRMREKSLEFIDRYRFRAGVEATMSEYNKLTWIKHLRVRGLPAVRFCATLKAIAVNIYRATAVRNTRNREAGFAKDTIFFIYDIIFAFKASFDLVLVRFRFMCY